MRKIESKILTIVEAKRKFENDRNKKSEEILSKADSHKNQRKPKDTETGTNLKGSQ